MSTANEIFYALINNDLNYKCNLCVISHCLPWNCKKIEEIEKKELTHVIEPMDFSAIFFFLEFLIGEIHYDCRRSQFWERWHHDVAPSSSQFSLSEWTSFPIVQNRSRQHQCQEYWQWSGTHNEMSKIPKFWQITLSVVLTDLKTNVSGVVSRTHAYTMVCASSCML